MREIGALIRASWQTAVSYRLSLVFSVLSLFATVIPLYFVSGALQSTAAKAIANQGGQYFSFVLVGMVTFSLIMTAVNAVPGVVSSGIGTGTLEALMSTRASFPAVLTGLAGYSVLWTGLRGVLTILAGWALGAHILWHQGPAALGILLLTVLAYVPVGLVSAAFVLAFRTATPLAQGVLLLSGLLGGVYYPTHVIPSWIQTVSRVLPLTYGLRAAREVFLDGAPVREVMPDVVVVIGFALVLWAVGLFALAEAMQYARRSGTLAQY